MGTRSGLDSQLGFATEVTYGTPVTPVRFVEFDEEDLSYTPSWLEGEGLRAGRKFKRSSRVGVSRKDIKGKTSLKIPNKGLGMLLKAMIGSSATATQIGATTAYQQIHTPGDLFGKALTVQVGRPEPGTGTVRPFTYTGCKVASWELSVSDGEHATLSVTWTGRDEDTVTGLATATYPAAAGLFNFSHASLKLGGTVTTSGTPSQMGVAGGVAVATIINSISIKGENPLADDRYGVGNAGLKAEPLENDYPSITASVDAEFSKAELYDVYKAGTPTAMQLSLAFGDAGGANPFLLDFISPKAIFKKAAPTVKGADLVKMSTDVEFYDDEVNGPFQFKYVSSDTAI